jgi:ribosomal protein S18 acetylase RimI-like enzyme
MQSETIKPVLAFIVEKVRTRIATMNIEAPESIGLETKLITSGIFDSISFLGLLGDIESYFNIELDLTDYDPADFTSVGGLAHIATQALSNGKLPSSFATQDETPGFDIVILTDRSDYWNELGNLFEAMYDSFDQRQLTLKLRKNGATIWLDGLAKSASSMQSVFGCIAGGVLVGFLYCSIRVVPPHLAMKMVGSIEALFVDPSHRGKRIAEALMRRAQKWFAEKGVSHIELQVLTSNDGALKFWERQAFRPELIQMTKALDPQ